MNNTLEIPTSTIVAPEKSTHHCPVFYFDFDTVKKHPDADRLGIYQIPDSDYYYVLNLEDWANYKGLVAWIPPDSLVNTLRKEFDFLIKEAKFAPDSSKPGDYAKIKAKKLRGRVSYGLLTKLDSASFSLGTNASEFLDIHHFEAPISTGGGKGPSSGGEVASPPQGVYPKYDIDSALKYGRKLFVNNEPVWIYEKIHGANSRFIYKDGQMHCGSRTEWKKEYASPPKLTLEELIQKTGDEKRAKQIYEKAVTNFKPKRNLWWIALENTPKLREYCEKNEGYCVYGEVFGQVQNLKYGAKDGQVWFAAFDILQPDGTWMNMPDFQITCDKWDIPTCPLIAKDYPFDLDNIVTMTNMNSSWPGANHYCEGLVVTPSKERWDNRLGRVKLKFINPEYLEKS